jgi:hypothetical protein
MPTDVISRKMNSVLFSFGGTNFLSGSPFGTASEPSIWMMIYIGIYMVAMLYMAISYFNRRDI